jgi:hypothetical protein
MAGVIFHVVGIDDIIGIPELGAQILDFLDDTADLRSTALTSRRFNLVTQGFLWRAVNLPAFGPDPMASDQRSFWDRFASPLASHTLSLRFDLRVVASDLVYELTARRWESRALDPFWHDVSRKVDDLFNGLEETLMRTPRLRSFTARDVPRILDLAILLQRRKYNVSQHASEAQNTVIICNIIGETG